ncbi:hypothetical protein BGW80DRAFT_1255392 [Lactifluus volemus]|nr:hypothetical protein BGW80DRAFT_1255392 [Lactifluus volemus]
MSAPGIAEGTCGEAVEDTDSAVVWLGTAEACDAYLSHMHNRPYGGLTVALEITDGVGDTEVWERYSPDAGGEHDIGIKGRTLDKGELDREEGGGDDGEEEDIGEDDSLDLGSTTIKLRSSEWRTRLLPAHVIGEIAKFILKVPKMIMNALIVALSVALQAMNAMKILEKTVNVICAPSEGMARSEYMDGVLPGGLMKSWEASQGWESAKDQALKQAQEAALPLQDRSDDLIEEGEGIDTNSDHGNLSIPNVRALGQSQWRHQHDPDAKSFDMRREMTRGHPSSEGTKRDEQGWMGSKETKKKQQQCLKGKHPSDIQMPLQRGCVRNEWDVDAMRMALRSPPSSVLLAAVAADGITNSVEGKGEESWLRDLWHKLWGRLLIAVVAGVMSSDDCKRSASVVQTPRTSMRFEWLHSVPTLPRNDTRPSLVEGEKGGVRKPKQTTERSVRQKSGGSVPSETRKGSTPQASGRTRETARGRRGVQQTNPPEAERHHVGPAREEFCAECSVAGEGQSDMNYEMEESKSQECG